MIEEIILNRLNAELVGIPAFADMPETMPDEFVYFEKTGSGRLDLLDSAVIILKSYAGSLCRAAQINELVKSVMDALPRTDPVFSARLNSDYNFTDTTTKRYRYQAIYDITF